MADINEDDITERPTEEMDDKDTGGHGGQDSGDEPTESSEDRDTGGDGNQDSGDQ